MRAPRDLLPHVVLALLLLAPAVTFLHTEQLKLGHAPIGRPHVGPPFSPGCAVGPRCTAGAARRATVRFLLRRPGRVALAVVDHAGRVVRSLGPARELPRGWVRTSWDGRSDAGALAPDGIYRLRVELVSLGRSITIHD